MKELDEVEARILYGDPNKPTPRGIITGRRGEVVVRCARCRVDVDFVDSFLGAPYPYEGRESGMLCRTCFEWDAVFGLRPTGPDALVAYAMATGASYSDALARYHAIPDAAVLRLRALAPARRFDPEFVSADEWGV